MDIRIVGPLCDYCIFDLWYTRGVLKRPESQEYCCVEGNDEQRPRKGCLGCRGGLVSSLFNNGEDSNQETPDQMMTRHDLKQDVHQGQCFLKTIWFL